MSLLIDDVHTSYYHTLPRKRRLTIIFYDVKVTISFCKYKHIISARSTHPRRNVAYRFSLPKCGYEEEGFIIVNAHLVNDAFAPDPLGASAVTWL